MTSEVSALGARSSFGHQVARALRRPQFWFALPWLAITAVWYGVFSYGPIVRAIPLALQRYKLMDPRNSPFVGLDNFRQIMVNPLFWPGVLHTLQWTVLMFLMMLPLSLLLAVLLSNQERFRNLFQGISFVPVVVSIAAIALLFRMLMDPNLGQFNQILRRLGLKPYPFLTDESTALFSVALIAVWKGVGTYVVTLSAGILGIPHEIYEAALVDGATEWHRFWRITLPLLGHQLVLITVLLAIGAMQEFSLPFLMTNGGPGNATMLYNLLVYNEAFQSMRFGTASAAALMQFVVIMGISLAQIKLFRPNWSY